MSAISDLTFPVSSHTLPLSHTGLLQDSKQTIIRERAFAHAISFAQNNFHTTISNNWFLLIFWISA